MFAGTNTIGTGTTLTNSGTLKDTGTLTGEVSLVSSAALFSVASTGLVNNSGTRPLIGGNAGSVINDGSIAGGAGAGVSINGTGSVLNRGNISAGGGVTVYLPTGTVTNLGTISNTNSLGFDVDSNIGLVVVNGATNVTSALINAAHIGVNTGNTGTAGSVVNYGTIVGSNFIGVRLQSQTGTDAVINRGTILSGGIDAAAVYSNYSAVGSVDNSGVIQNTANGGLGVYFRINGSVTNSGLISGGGDGFRVSSGFGATVNNSGTLGGGTGFFVFSSGTTSETLIDSGTLTGTSGTAAHFGAGADLLKFTPSASVVVQGTVDGGTGTNTLELTSAASHGTLTGVGADFANFQNGTIDSGAYWVFAGTNTFASSTTLTDSGKLVDVGTLTNAGMLTVDPPIYVSGLFINTGSVNAPGTFAAISITNGGVLTNAATGIITSGTSVTDAIHTSGTIQIANYGTITQSRSGSSAIHLTGGGNIVNGSAADTSALIEGYMGLFAQGGRGTITNFGTIESNPTFNAVGLNLDVGGVVLNGTTGSTTALISGRKFGLNANSGVSTVFNYGTITGNSIGVYFIGGGTVVDSGRIAAGVGGSAIFFGARNTGGNLVVLENGYSVSGSIVSSPGIYSSRGTANNVVELLGTSTANAVTATYNNLKLTNFGTIAFGPSIDNYATLRITNNATLPHTIVNFTGIHDTIDLSALAYVTANSSAHLNTATNQLTVTNGTSSVALQLGSGSYTGTNWRVANDGSGGTDVIASARPTSFLIHNETELNAAFSAISVGGVDSYPGTGFTLTFANSFALNSAVNGVTLDTGSSVTIDGAGFTLSGGGGAYGFINSTSPITVENLAIVNTQASVSSGGSWTLAGTDTLGSTTTLTNFGTLGDTGTLVNDGTLTGGGSRPAISLASAGSLLNRGNISATGTYAVYAGSGSLTNLGTISDTTTVGFAVDAPGGVVINGSTGATSALISSGHIGVYEGVTGAGGSVINYGTITGNFFGIKLQGSTGTDAVTNHGTILSSGLAIGVYSTGGAVGTVDNTGVIQGTSSSSYGVYFSINGSVTNSGLISGTSDGFRVNSRYGAVVNNSGTLGGGTGFVVFGTSATNETLLDTGAIAGTSGTAAHFGSGNDLLKFTPSASVAVQGTVDGGAGTNTLEFASAASHGTLTGDGADFVNFTQGTIDSGAYWVFAGTNTLASTTTLTNSGTLVDTGNFINAGTITGTGTFIIDPTTFTNSGYLGITTTLAGSGDVLTNTSTGTISVGGSGGKAVTGAGTVDNLGTILANGTGGIGVSLSSGNVTNGASNATNAVIHADSSAISVSAGANSTINNFGTLISVTRRAVVLPSGTLLNGASGSTAALIQGVGQAVFGGNPGSDATVVNFGTIQGSGGYGASVALLSQNTVHLANYGTLTGYRYGAVASASAISVTRELVCFGCRRQHWPLSRRDIDSHQRQFGFKRRADLGLAGRRRVLFSQLGDHH